MLTQAPKGTKDVLPKESYKWHYIEGEVRKICAEFGYSEIRTPTFEHTELILRGVGETTDIVQKEMYTFNDKAGRSITLKPEGTAPAVRAFIEHGLQFDTQPTKLYYITPVFRYENVQAGRLREHHQFGIEMFGSPSPSADAEVISLAMTFLKRLGLDNLKVNINNIGCPECRKNYNEALKNYLKDNLEELCDVCRDRYERNPLRILDCKEKTCQRIVKEAPIITDYVCDNCKNHFEGLKHELELLGIHYEVDPHIVRGLDYYTQTVFEIISSSIKENLTICGGGRYNNLIKEIGGPDMPAVGFGLGLERLILTLESKGIEIPKPKGISLYVASIGDKAKDEAAKIVYGLRNKGISCERDLMNKSLKAQMKYANKIGAKYVIVLGDEEIENNRAKLKEMETGQEEEIVLSDIYEVIKERI
ncbi:histidine--tRNA ligase [Caloramator australicus]|uniref:Histidine--tRNA ligase n=1 Tax=Caloramator australicus RC3 TaxID=857293 RepID=I7KAB6_9CLOT|nr:histidine--tRNA ligase [Caloramator australicus]CCJ34677.1 Histidyl-tRNA synthetase [Caloramator australicus RC3]